MLISEFKIIEELLEPLKVYNLSKFKAVKGFSIDSRTIKEGQAFIAIKGKHQNGHKFIRQAANKGAGAVISQERIPDKIKVPFFTVKDTYQSLQAAAAYIRREKNPIVCAVTGSLGKTTTKEMLSFLLKPRFETLKNKKTENNLLGLAKTIFSLEDEKAAVLELGTNFKGEIELLSRISKPDVGVITFIKPAHLQGLGDLKGILDEKMSIFKANSRMKAVLNRDDPLLAKARGPEKTYFFGKAKNNNISGRLLKRKGTISVFLIQDKYRLSLPFYMEGFITNYLAAISAAHVLGIRVKDSVERIGNFCDFAPMRMQMSEAGDFLVLNDAYNANPYSFAQALKSLKKAPFKKVAVIGDMLELGEKSIYYHKQLASQVIKAGCDYCLSLGRHMAHLKEKLKEMGYKQAFHFDSHQQIADFINEKQGVLQRGKRCLIFLKGSRNMELEKVIDYLNC